MCGGYNGPLVFEQSVEIEADHFLTEPAINVFYCFLQGQYFVDGEDAPGLLNITERSSAFRHCAHHLRRDAVSVAQIVARCRFDVKKLILCRYPARCLSRLALWKYSTQPDYLNKSQ